MTSDQLELALEATPSAGRLPTRLEPMHPSAGPSAFDDRDYFFEPWWPGSRAFAFLEADGLRIQSEHLADPVTSFPELGEIRTQTTAPDLVLDGTLLVLDDTGRPDANLLRARLQEPTATSRREGAGAFICSDLLYERGRPLLSLPFRERRARLGTVLHDGERCVVSRGLTGEGTTLARAVEGFGLEALSARRLDGRYRRGAAGEAWLRIPLVPAPTVERRPLLALLQRLPL